MPDELDRPFVEHSANTNRSDDVDNPAQSHRLLIPGLP